MKAMQSKVTIFQAEVSHFSPNNLLQFTKAKDDEQVAKVIQEDGRTLFSSFSPLFRPLSPNPDRVDVLMESEMRKWSESFQKWNS